MIALSTLVFLAIISFIFPKRALIMTLYWIVWVGAVRKWLLPEWSDILFFSPHIFLFGPYIRFLMARGQYTSVQFTRLGSTKVLFFLMGLLLFWGTISIVNPRSPDIRIGIVGLIIHFYFIPTIFILPSIFQTRDDLIDFLKKFTLCSIPVLLLGFVQFFSPTMSELNKYVGGSTDIAMIAQHPRITGTFSYIAGYSTYLNVIILILIFLFSREKLSALSSIGILVQAILAIANLLMTGSRGPVWISLISMIVYMIVSSRLGVQFAAKTLIRFILAGALITYVFTSLNRPKEAFEAFQGRVEGASDVNPRLITTFTPLSKFLGQAGLFGYGIGTTYQGNLKWDIDRGDMTDDYEEEPGRILLELGLIGYLLVYLLRLALIIQFWALFKRLRDMDLKLLALCSLLFQLQFLHFRNLVFDFTSHIFYWFFVSFLFLLPRLDLDEEQIKTEPTTI